MYNSSNDGNMRYYSLLGLSNFDTPEVRIVMERALEDDYVPPNMRESKDEDRFIIRQLAGEYFSEK